MILSYTGPAFKCSALRLLGFAVRQLSEMTGGGGSTRVLGVESDGPIGLWQIQAGHLARERAISPASGPIAGSEARADSWSSLKSTTKRIDHRIGTGQTVAPSCCSHCLASRPGRFAR